MAGGRPGPQVGLAHILHDRPDVGEIEVDQPGLGDEVGDALDRLAEDVVGHAEGVLGGGLLAGCLEEPVVGDGDHRVGHGLELPQAFLGLPAAVFHLEGEGEGDDGDQEQVEVGGHFGDDRGGPGARAAAQPRGQEDHVRALERAEELVLVLLGRLAAEVGPAPRAQPLGRLAADLDLGPGPAGVEGLQVGIDGDAFDPLDAHGNHPVEGVPPAAADAHDLDVRPGGLLRQQEPVSFSGVVGHDPSYSSLNQSLILDMNPLPRSLDWPLSWSC